MHKRFTQFTLLITRISRSIRRLKTDEMKKWGLKSHHVSCLYYLYCSKSLTATELCEMCGEDKSALSRAIEALENEGYIDCNIKAQKRYRSPLVLTEKGMEAGKRIYDRVDQVYKEASEGISEEDRRILYSCLDKICLKLEEMGDNNGNKE
ncbi:MAG: MarR family transcriptional regulator [Clostridia bacterium]|nr:MarR family transcriptional regulator [Clostridia bacterium]